MTVMDNEGIAAFNGFVSNTQDALILFEACKRGILPRTPARLSEQQRKAIKSGDVFVFSEEESKIKRWTDGRRWSPSRILNNFLIYRELELNESPPPTPVSQPQEPPNFLSSSVGSSAAEKSSQASPTSEHPSESSSSGQASTSRRGSRDANVADSRRTSVSIVSGPEEPKRALLGTLGGGGRLREGGFVKKTISVAGLHMISYYDTADVLEGKLKTPTSIPELMKLEIGPQFLLAQYFRHPPQVSIDAQGVPHFAGLTDDEPMVRRPAQNPQQRKPKLETEHAVNTSGMDNLSLTSPRDASQAPASHTAGAPTTPAPAPPSASSATQHSMHQQPYGQPTQDSSGRSYLPMAGPNHYSTVHEVQSSPFTRGHWSLGDPVVPSRPPPNPLPTASGLTRSNTSLSSTSDNSDPVAAGAPARQTGFSSSHRHEPYRLPSQRAGRSGSTSASHSSPTAAHTVTSPYQYSGYNPDAQGPVQYYPAHPHPLPRIDTALANTARSQHSRHGRSSSWQLTESPDKESFGAVQSYQDSFEITPTLASAPTMVGPSAGQASEVQSSGLHHSPYPPLSLSTSAGPQNVRPRPWTSPADHVQQYPELRTFSVPSSNADYFAYDYPFHYHSDATYPAPTASLLPVDTNVPHTSSPLPGQTPASSSSVSPAVPHPPIATFSPTGEPAHGPQHTQEGMVLYPHPSSQYQMYQGYQVVSPQSGYAVYASASASPSKPVMPTVPEGPSSANATPNYPPEAQAFQYQQQGQLQQQQQEQDQQQYPQLQHHHHQYQQQHDGPPFYLQQTALHTYDPQQAQPNYAPIYTYHPHPHHSDQSQPNYTHPQPHPQLQQSSAEEVQYTQALPYTSQAPPPSS